MLSERQESPRYNSLLKTSICIRLLILQLKLYKIFWDSLLLKLQNTSDDKQCYPRKICWLVWLLLLNKPDSFGRQPSFFTPIRNLHICGLHNLWKWRITDHRSKCSNLSNWKEEAWKNKGFNGIRTRDLRDTGAMLYQLSYEATISGVHIFPCSEVMWSIWYRSQFRALSWGGLGDRDVAGGSGDTGTRWWRALRGVDVQDGKSLDG